VIEIEIDVIPIQCLSTKIVNDKTYGDKELSILYIKETIPFGTLLG